MKNNKDYYGEYNINFEYLNFLVLFYNGNRIKHII